MRLEQGERPRWPSVGELAEAEVLMALPPMPYPATIEERRFSDDRATVAFRGNRYSVNPGLGGIELTLRHRLGTGSLEIYSPQGTELVSHVLALAGSGQIVRTAEHRAALEAVVLGQFSTARPCDRKANKPPGQAALAERARLLGRCRDRAERRSGRDRRGDRPCLSRHDPGAGMTEGSEYQKLRSHLAFLRMTAAAEALPGELDYALKQKLTHQGFLERLLSIEVDSVEQRRRAGLLRFAALPSPFTLSDFDFSAQPSVDKKLIDDLATLRFYRRCHQRVVDRAARGGKDDAGRRSRSRGCRGGDAGALHDGG